MVPNTTTRRTFRLCRGDEQSLNRYLVPKLLFDRLGIDYAVTVPSESNVVGSGKREVEVHLLVGSALIYLSKVDEGPEV